MAWQDNTLRNNTDINRGQNNADVPLLFGYYHAVDSNNYLVPNVDNNGTGASYASENGYIAANILQLQLPSTLTSIVPLTFKSQFHIWSQIKRYQSNVVLDSNKVVQNKLIFTCRGLALTFDYDATTLPIKTTKLSDGTIACYIADLRCRVIKDYYSSASSTSDGFGSYTSSIKTSPIDKTRFCV